MKKRLETRPRGKNHPRYIHGHAIGKPTPTYNTWVKMLSRVRGSADRNPAKQRNYSAKGVTVSRRWLKFENFLADMGEKPSSIHSIDRKSGNLGYCKNNCRWATPTEQGRNRKNNNRITAFGETLTISEWSDRTGLAWTTIKNRINRGLSPEQSLSKSKAAP